ncbi:NAD-binding protein [Sulfurovum sp. NBC37-1]|uniref:NAD-binding protein n=1 Tax=Sulfurovum sp. (strain NBC37-1) TaxID=387093 RepID=UPI0001587593|nr:NAD-binding protein [Sulfurovum sp. NBC37-1]BAF71207.1 K+ transport system, NAD-binding component [Sulfurovum sp. NBC37-1]
MDIMIAGAGTVGYGLAHTLSFQHNVMVIDKDLSKLNKLDEDVDVLVVHGDVENPKTYQSLNIDTVDLFIAVTDSDEANLLSTLIVEDVVEVKRKIIRLKNDGFLKSHVLEKLSIDYAVFPDITTANKVKALFTFPKANNVKTFHQTKHKLISIRVQYDAQMLYRVNEFVSDAVAIVGIEREKTFFVPSKDERIEKGDLVYLFGDMDAIENISAKLDEKMPSSIKKIVIFGANTLAQKIAKALLDKKLDIKMIEKDISHCRAASELLQDRVTIINSAYEDQRLFEDEGLKNADMIIAASHDDEKNIVKCIEAKEYGIEKVVAVNNDKAYYNLMHKMGVVVVRGSKAGAHYAILEKISSSSIVTQRHFCGGSGILFMRKVYPNSTLIGKKLGNAKIDRSIVLLLREGKLYDFSEISQFEQGDIVVVFGEFENKEEIQQWIYTL